MLAIILGILKFIGLLLLGILGLLLALILLVLLVPVRYRAFGSCYGELKGAASVSWLFHILSCQVKYDGEPDMCIRVFGIRVGAGAAKKKPKRDTSDADFVETDLTDAGPMKTDAADKDSPAPLTGADNRAEMETEKTAGTKTAVGTGKTAGTQKKADAQKKTQTAKKRRRFSFGNPFEKIRVTFGRICDKLKAVKEKKEQVLAFINQEDNRRTFRLIKKQAGVLLKHILPQTVKGKIRFGFEDPYTTGQILTWVSPFYGLYARNLQLIPAFEEPVLEGELNLKGRIRIGALLAVAVRIYMDKNFRMLLKKWREA